MLYDSKKKRGGEMVVAQCKSIENVKQESYTSKRDITTIASCQFENYWDCVGGLM